ncbi:MAG: hypothetical protein JSW00_04655 [Thermoplasmata archaeon]|nr:MAG: hypothetical protein JSW00_04655 [Thermoplasmata archaeon]
MVCTIRSLKKKVNIISSTPILLLYITNIMKPPVVEQVFLIHEDGRLISYASLKGDVHKDENIVSCMLTAVKDLLTVVFVKKDAKENVGQYKFELGERNVILRMGKNFYLAIVTKGEENEALIDKFSAIVDDIQERYGDVFKNWSGEMKYVEGVDEIIMKLLPLEELSEAERETIKDKGFLKKVIEIWSSIMND